MNIAYSAFDQQRRGLEVLGVNCGNAVCPHSGVVFERSEY